MLVDQLGDTHWYFRQPGLHTVSMREIRPRKTRVNKDCCLFLVELPYLSLGKETGSILLRTVMEIGQGTVPTSTESILSYAMYDPSNQDRNQPSDILYLGDASSEPKRRYQIPMKQQ